MSAEEPRGESVKPFSNEQDAMANIVAQDAGCQMLQALRRCLQLTAPGRLHAERKLIQALLAQVKIIAYARECSRSRKLCIAFTSLHQGVANSAIEPLSQLLEAFFHLVLRGGDELGCGRGRGSAQVGHKVGNGEVCFMT